MLNKTTLTLPIDFGDKTVLYRLVHLEYGNGEDLPESLVERAEVDAIGDPRWVPARNDHWASVVAHIAISYLMRHNVATGSQTTIGAIKYDKTSKNYSLNLAP